MATSQLAMWAASVTLFFVFQTCWAQQGVCYVKVSSTQSYATSLSHQDRTCSRSWWRRRCRTFYRAVYSTSYRTVYSSQFACCHGYTHVGAQCIPLDCGTLTAPANGQVTYSGRTTFRHTATYSCDAGYDLIGGTIRMCQVRGTTGVWSGSAPTCHPVDCGALTNPASGRVNHTAGTTFGHTATYSCNTGYNLMGDNTRTCQATRVWSGSAPTCQGFHNSLFQLHLFGAIVCHEWVTSDKASDIAEDVARELEIICSCGFSEKYIGGVRLMCGDNNSTGQVIFLARMISFDGVNSTDLLSQLQQWVQTKPTVTVEGVSMTISGDCSVNLGELSTPTCNPTNLSSSPEPTTPVANTDNKDEPSPTNLPVIPIAAGLGGGMFLLIVIILLLAIVLICKRRKRNLQLNSSHYATTTHEASGTDKQSNKFAESKLSTDGNKEEHLYDLPPDSRMSQIYTVTNPPTYKSSTKGFSYLTPNVDGTQFNFSGDFVDPYKSFSHHS